MRTVSKSVDKRTPVPAPPAVAEALRDYLCAKLRRREAIQAHEEAYGTPESHGAWAAYFVAAELDNVTWKRLGAVLRAIACEEGELQVYRLGEWTCRLALQPTGPMEPEVEHVAFLGAEEGGDS